MTETLAETVKLITHGVFVIGVSDGEHRNAFTAAWVMQASFNPLMLAFSTNPEHYSFQLLKSGGICSINVLGREQLAVAEHFGRSSTDKMAGFDWLQAKTGAPIWAGGLAYFDCEVSHFCAAGDHTLVVCTVLEAARLNQGAPLLYRETGDMDGSSAFYGAAAR